MIIKMGNIKVNRYKRASVCKYYSCLKKSRKVLASTNLLFNIIIKLFKKRSLILNDNQKRNNKVT